MIITSDDAGMCKAVNEGTILAMQSGLVSTTSIMTCCPEYEAFAEFALNHPEHDYGVHLVLTCDLRELPWGPITGMKTVPSLTGGDGNFYLWPPQNVDYGEARLELKAQIDRALNSGIRISHLDHHMWVMFHSPEMLSLYVELGMEYNLPIRFCRTAPDRLSNNPQFLKEYKRKIRILENNGFPVLDFIEYRNYSVEPGKKREYYLDQIHKLPIGISEFNIHCSLIDDQINPPDVEKRLSDLQFFSSGEASTEFQQCRIEQIDWEHFR
ncbi:MAG: polysaccharide deacetylase family protein [Planctomycetaceae bacterium]